MMSNNPDYHYKVINFCQIESTLGALDKLTTEYNFVNTKTSSLNEASENLIEEQRELCSISDDIKFRLKHFTQAEHLIQRLQNPTFSPSSEQFADIINSIDECMDYLKEHVNILTDSLNNSILSFIL